MHSVNYELSWAKTQKAEPSGIGTVLLMGDSEATRRAISTSSSSASN